MMYKTQTVDYTLHRCRIATTQRCKKATYTPPAPVARMWGPLKNILPQNTGEKNGEENELGSSEEHRGP